jgi:hypothetical protein
MRGSSLAGKRTCMPDTAHITYTISSKNGSENYIAGDAPGGPNDMGPIRFLFDASDLLEPPFWAHVILPSHMRHGSLASRLSSSGEKLG